MEERADRIFVQDGGMGEVRLERRDAAPAEVGIAVSGRRSSASAVEWRPLEIADGALVGFCGWAEFLYRTGTGKQRSTAVSSTQCSNLRIATASVPTVPAHNPSTSTARSYSFSKW